MVHQVLLCLDPYDTTDAIAINKPCKLNFKCCFFLHLTISQQQGYQGFFFNSVLLRF